MMLPDSDSHEKIREKYSIRDGLGASASLQTPLEYYPTTNLYDFSTYKFEFDDKRPEWWTDEMTESAIRQFQSDINFIIKSEFEGFGDLDLRGLTSLPENAKLTAGGHLYLSGLTSLPENAKLTAGGHLYLRGLTSLPENAKLTAGGHLYLRGLTSIPAKHKCKSKRIYLKNGKVIQ
ncbi:MAG: hypothetical protein WC551_10775 [Patescibacteria group bacterium]